MNTSSKRELLLKTKTNNNSNNCDKMRCIPGFLSLLAGVCSAPVTLRNEDGVVSVENGFVSFEVSVSGGAWLSSLRGDFQGGFNYGENVLAANGGLRFERIEADGAIVSGAGRGDPASVVVLRQDDECVEIAFPDVKDDIRLPMANEEWHFSLCKDQRSVHFTAKGNTLNNDEASVRAIVHTMYATPLSTFGFFDQGVVQMKDASPERSYFGSIDRLHRAYILGQSGAVDVLRPEATGGEDDVTILMNSADSQSFHGGLQELVFGSYANLDAWTWGWSDSATVSTVVERDWVREWVISPNNRNFPTATLPSGEVSNMDNGIDLEGLMTGIYANSVGCLCTYPGAVRAGHQVGQIATTIRTDNHHGYNDTYNYFDPDNFIGLSAMLYSGDDYLLNQARIVIERSGSFIKPENGQLPHHFVGIEPYYLALSGETQTGPNTFWVKTALQYAFVSGDIDWLKSYMPVLRNASSFVFDLVDETNLILAPGSLMIDVFIRNNYTADSNAMVVGFMRDFAEAERAVGNEDRAVELEQKANDVVDAMNSMLWASEDAGGDHFITQINTDGTTRDFVDYDANLIAVAHAVTDESRSRAILTRIDGGQCSASSGAGPQFVSELYYGKDDTTNGNQGDSWCSMARIGWFDSHARKRLGTGDDLNYVNDRIVSTVQTDVIKNTWMHERYGCDGVQQENRTMYYFEYPSMLAMVLREIRYGINLRITDVTINPFGVSEFEYHTGNINVVYSNTGAVISLPGSGLRTYKLHGLVANKIFRVSVDSACRSDVNNHKEVSSFVHSSDDDGLLTFQAPIGGLQCSVSVQKL